MLRDVELTAARYKVPRGRLRPRQGYERALVHRHKPPRRRGARDCQSLLQKVDHRAQFPRHKGPRFGMGMSALRISDPQRRDRLLL